MWWSSYEIDLIENQLGPRSVVLKFLLMYWDSDSGKKDDLISESEIDVSDFIRMGIGAKEFKFGKDDKSTLKVGYEKKHLRQMIELLWRSNAIS